MTLDEVERAIDAVRRGEFVVVVDDEDRENEGDLIIAADRMTPEKMAFMIRYTSGVICLPMEAAGRRNQLPLMVSGAEKPKANGPFHGFGRCQTGTTTGISAADAAPRCALMWVDGVG
jgi:3,4-dihydroxy-2-butanone 4-phosphate synthase